MPAEWEELRTAILRQAVEDYKQALRDEAEGRMNTRRDCRSDALRAFFLSPWGQYLSYNHGEMILEKLDKEFKEEQERHE